MYSIPDLLPHRQRLHRIKVTVQIDFLASLPYPIKHHGRLLLSSQGEMPRSAGGDDADNDPNSHKIT